MKDIEKIIEIIEENEVTYKGVNETRLHSAENIIDYFENKSAIKQVELFQKTFGDIVAELGEIPSVEKRKLRLKLIFEELSELAEAYGLESTFNHICINHLDFSKETIDTEIFNPEEALDATCDLLVVTYGAVCINGHSTIIDEAFDETMKSNMSKSCNTLDEAQYTVAQYHKEGRNTYYKLIYGLYVIYDSNTHKILKNKDEINGFFKPDYKKLLRL